MVLNQQFVESLIALRSYYESLHDQIESALNHAREQLLHHAHTLLFEQAVEDQQLIQSLLAMRDQWRRLSADCSSQLSHTREQLAHVNALLADQLVWQQSQQPVSITASAINENENFSATDGADISTDKSLKETKELYESNVGEADEVEGLEEANSDKPCQPEELETASPTEELSKVDNSNNELGNPTLTTWVQSKTEQSALSLEPNNELEAPRTTNVVNIVAQAELEPSVDNDNAKALKSGATLIKTPMLPKYDHLTKFQAVESVLRSKAGSILHIDWIIRALHGELAEDDVRAERGRMSQTLIDGVKKGLWSKVPGESGCYTIDLELVQPDLTQKANQKQVALSQAQQSNGKFPPEMLPPYQGGKLIEAVSIVMSEKAGEILTVDLVTQILYGELSGKALASARKKVSKALWDGVSRNHWQRVPEGSGRYTLDLRLLDQ